MRYCAFHRKPFPSHLLQRFEIGLHPETRAAWAFPSDAGDHRGYYAKLNPAVLSHVQKQDHKRLFRGAARYPKNMNQYLDQRMMQTLVKQASLVKYTRTPTAPGDDYQCVLQLKPPPLSSISAPDITTYALFTPSWQPLYDALLAHLGDEDDVPATLGVVKSIDSVPFAVALFRYQLWLQSLTPSLLKA
ncbi:hypothetical protein BCR42DRAFT_421371 [Absidia repens]|uniref:Uncharacterized protein n=1 Tax=Absidia repens TaxID=90262 RepID=A0A1X2I8J5_9FUNG|nr:hypothetical protein BCR42DRAFT_421371 [Absidia repens]